MPLTGHITADASAILNDLRDRAAVGVSLDATYRVGAVYLHAMHDRYVQFAAGGGDWAPLTEGTKRRKAALGYDPEAINIGDGRLMESLLPGGVENILDPDFNGVTCGTTVPYAASVQSRRPFLVDPDPPAESEMLRIAREDLVST